MEVSGQLHAPPALPLWKAPSTHWIEDWVHLRAGLNTKELRNAPWPSSLQFVCILTELFCHMVQKLKVAHKYIQHDNLISLLERNAAKNKHA
jgi:hypothetical protein